MAPETRYARRGDISIAFQVVGEGPLDLVASMGWVSHETGAGETYWNATTRASAIGSRSIGVASWIRPATDSSPCAARPGLEAERPGVGPQRPAHSARPERVHRRRMSARSGAKLGGIAVRIGARLAARAQPGEVLVSSTVRDLVSGSGIEFEPGAFRR